jgi:NitT/TauT family transport system substrate-binding protein
MFKGSLRLVSALVMLGCGSVGAAEPTKMRLGFSGSAGFVSAMVAKDQGFFEKHNLDVEMVFVTKGSIIVPSILGGSLEAGTMTSPSLIRGVEANMGLVALTATNVNSQDNPTSSLALRNGLEITNPKDLEGRKIGSAGVGGVLDITFRQWALDHGVNVRKLTFVEVGFPQMADMLKGGQIDAATISEPYLSRMVEVKAGQRGIPYFRDFPEGMIMGAFVAKKEWADKNREAAFNFRAAIADAVDLLRMDPAVAYPSLEKHLKLPADVVKSLPKVDVAVEISDEQLQFWNKVSKDQGLTTELVDVSKIYYK